METPNNSYHGKTVFATGLAVMALAALLAVQITLRPVPGAQGSPQSDAVAASNIRSELSTERPIRRDPQPIRSHERPISSTLAARSPARTSANRPFRLEVPQGHPERSRLAAEAERVAAHANERLDLLTRQLDLAPAQREKLFPLLARSSANYDSAMIVADADGASLGSDSPSEIVQTDPGELSAAMAAMMEPVQQEEWIEHQVNDSALWREIFNNLQRQLQEQTPDIPAAAEEAGSSGRSNIFDLIPATE
jgi:hypothetical protein